MAAVSMGSNVLFWKDCYLEKQKSPYFKHEDVSRKTITGCEFVPYEDFMGVCFNNKFESIFVPGTGSSDFDTFEDNLNPEHRQKREQVVHKLLEKVY